MTSTLVQRTLRVLAIAIAVLALVDPESAGRSRPRVALIDETTSRASSSLSANLTSHLGSGVEITRPNDPTADAWIVVADDEEAAVPAPPEGVSLSLVTPNRPSTSLVLEALDVPALVNPTSRVPVAASFLARGLAGRTSTIAVRSGPLVLGRVAHRWTADSERFVARFDVIPPEVGANHLVVDALEATAPSRRSRGDAVVVVDERRLPVLVFEGRPSWTTTFVRRALEADARFAVTAGSRVSRGIAATAADGEARSPGRPTAPVERLTPEALEPFASAIVGAPETLAADEIAALAAFAARGSALVLAPDRRPSGAYTSLIWNARVDERLLDEPVTLGLVQEPGLALMASELAETRALPPGARPIVAARTAASPSSSIWIAPSGAGQTLFVGALDAWRFRGRAGDGFDRWWPQVVEQLSREGAGKLAIVCDPQVATPGARVSVRVRLRVEDGAMTSLGVRAALARDSADVSPPDAPAVVRLWPEAEAGVFAGALNAPPTPGVYAVSVTADWSDAPTPLTASAPLIVEPGARKPRGADDRWRAAVASSGGVVASIDEAGHVRQSVDRRAIRRADERRGRPMRSAWWLAPFVACLGGEWWLRRRAGLR